jgi:hypothetical protein
MKNSDDTIGNRTRDLTACSAVPQPNEPPRAPQINHNTRNFVFLKGPLNKSAEFSSDKA